MKVIENKTNAPLIINGKILAPKAKISVSNEQLEAFAVTPAGKAHLEKNLTVTKGEADDPTSSDDFTFDPKVHHIEHRGGGKWYVMNGEEKVEGPISKEKAQEFEALAE